jgi:hypothetical protein
VDLVAGNPFFHSLRIHRFTQIDDKARPLEEIWSMIVS